MVGAEQWLVLSGFGGWRCSGTIARSEHGRGSVIQVRRANRGPCSTQISSPSHTYACSPLTLFRLFDMPSSPHQWCRQVCGYRWLSSSALCSTYSMPTERRTALSILPALSNKRNRQRSSRNLALVVLARNRRRCRKQEPGPSR